MPRAWRPHSPNAISCHSFRRAARDPHAAQETERPAEGGGWLGTVSGASMSDPFDLVEDIAGWVTLDQ